MHVLFVHQNYPAQFGHLANHMEQKLGWKTTFLTKWKGEKGMTPLLKYEPKRGSTQQTHFLSRNFTNCAAQAQGVYAAAQQMQERPDIVLGHSGFGSTLLLKELFHCPVVNLFEFFYNQGTTAVEYEKDELEDEYRRRLYFMNSMILSDLHVADAGYTPTHFQRNQFPVEYLPKIETLFDGIDRNMFRRYPNLPRKFRDREIPEDTRIISYVSRGFESMRGFDVFIRMAKRVYQEYPNVLFICAGSDRVCYGGDLRRIKEKSYKEHVLNKEQPDMSKFWFTGMVNTRELVQLLNLGDAHVYFTRPFVLSWSLFNALSCGARIVSSATEPVQEVITHGENGLLADFNDHEQHAQHVLQLLRAPKEYQHFRVNGQKIIAQRYSMQQCLPRFVRLIQRIVTPDTSDSAKS